MNAAQLRMARAALSLTVRQTAEVGGVSHDTITRIEAGEKLKESTVQKVSAALEAMGVEFTNGDAPGVRLRPRN